MPTADDNVFGEGHEIHPITKMPIEAGRGALPIDQQVMGHLRMIQAERGEGAADVMRKEMGIPTRADIEAAAKQKAAEKAKNDERVQRALALLDQVEKDESEKAKESK